jgi:cell division protein ZapE
MVAAGEIRGDPAQADVVRRLDLLNQRLAASAAPASGRVLARLRAPRREAVRGLYIHGEVGRGKTMLMDAFFAEAVTSRKRRAHYNDFMGDVQDRLHAARQAGGAPAADPIAAVAAATASEARLLCLDEFAVTDIADAMILSRLFGELFAVGLTLVATSNVAPEELYRDGLNRGLFLPFLAQLRAACEIVSLDGDIDYRLEKLTASEVYVTPLGPAATRSLDLTFHRLTGLDRAPAAALRVKGRDVAVPQAAAGVARFAFADLCEAPLGAGDYIAIARAFNTLVVDGIPALRPEQRDVARRLILLVDTLYDHRVNLIVSAATEPAGLYRATSGDEALAFKRTVSRLIEMRSVAYLGAAHGARGAAEPLAPEHQSG